ncbi:MAG TPA: tRNA (N6-isopentenyl adenosine(37)-C2)-methylthiotransferase MiaB [Thermoanaerobaculia bacterium]|nr:tRNA (N6-isopentenyl adenosine(37)-C2)-methylthiotransferase MiaB [Thermoanaerobaculia bacterium]
MKPLAPPPARRYFVETWGCQMNELDSQRMAGQLMRQGILPTRDPRQADLILLNSCSVREKAAQKAYSRLGEYRLLKAERPGLRIGLCGCVAQQEGERALERSRGLDFVLGPARVGELAALLPRIQAGERVIATGFPEEREYDFDAVAREGAFKGMVTIIEGCDKRCTFCIVPTTRGPERCRPLAEVVAEVRHLVEFGFHEIELLGQTVNHWREPGGAADFADLLDAVAPLPGLRRLRFVTSYPRDFTPRMVERYALYANLCDYLHLPVQSGSDAVLRRMGRGYAVAEYLELLGLLRATRSSIAVSTDLIVGFPGESDADFEATLTLVERARFSALFAFRYSPRPGTAAPRLDGAVPTPVAEERLRILLARQNEIQVELNRELAGREMEVLITGWGREPRRFEGRTSCHRIVHFEAAAGTAPAPGELVTVRIHRGLPHSLLGEQIAAPAGAGLGAWERHIGRLPVVA